MNRNLYIGSISVLAMFVSLTMTPPAISADVVQLRCGPTWLTDWRPIGTTIVDLLNSEIVAIPDDSQDRLVYQITDVSDAYVVGWRDEGYRKLEYRINRYELTTSWAAYRVEPDGSLAFFPEKTSDSKCVLAEQAF